MLSASSSSIFHSSSPFIGDKITSKTQSTSPETVKLRPLRVSAAAAASYYTSTTARFTYLNPNGMASSCLSLYEVLGISMGASGQEIKSAYRRLARVCHPDVAAIDRKDTSADAFMKIHAAYSTLSDPGKRADYDRELFRRHRPFDSYSVNSSTTTAMSGFSGSARRNWETDQCW